MRVWIPRLFHRSSTVCTVDLCVKPYTLLINYTLAWNEVPIGVSQRCPKCYVVSYFEAPNSSLSSCFCLEYAPFRKSTNWPWTICKDQIYAWARGQGVHTACCWTSCSRCITDSIHQPGLSSKRVSIVVSTSFMTEINRVGEYNTQQAWSQMCWLTMSFMTSWNGAWKCFKRYTPSPITLLLRWQQRAG